ncbi:MAG: YHS domain-containing (seleno)protein [Gammaproteobacteria bacterium]|nr:YHS domain-containing (seleno)protein [Gammaproteobacteria bacterium]
MKRILTFAAALLLCAPVMAKDPVFSTEQGAIRGFDPVAYFSEGKPVPGSADITHEWDGATWHFASEANRDRFIAEPKKFAPAYGGYCAYAVANGYTATTDPNAWSIVDDRLYLNYSIAVKQRWEKNISGYISKANKNWPGVLSK